LQQLAHFFSPGFFLWGAILPCHNVILRCGASILHHLEGLHKLWDGLDNVDQNSELDQFPQKDEDLQLFANSPSLNILLTSRLSSAINSEAYTPFEIQPLSTEQCVDLFYYYWKEKIRRSEDVILIRRLIDRASRHTLAIKLLALGARFRNLSEYVAEIEQVNFSFPIPTDSEDMTSIAQLKKLFDLKTRTKHQQTILWEFSLLPQTTLGLDEINFLFNYNRNDLQPLVDEGWLNYENGFYIHPLIKTVIHLGMVNNKAPKGTMSHLISLVAENSLIENNDTPSSIIRKINIVDTALPYIDIDSSKAVDFYYNLGMFEYKYTRKRLTSIEMLNIALNVYVSHAVSNEKLANLKYQLGYIKSTTQQYRSMAKYDLQEALDLWEAMGGHQYEIDMTHDHLGYVLSDSEDTFDVATKYLTDALQSRNNRFFEEKSKKAASDYATTCDNLGCLLLKSSPESPDAISLLRTAYEIRESIYREYGDNETDVAWTAFNIGQCLSKSNSKLKEAEIYLQRSLELRRKQNKIYPGFYTTNIVFTLVALAKTLLLAEDRTDDVKQLIREAISLKANIDDEHTGFFSEEVNRDIAYINETIREHSPTPKTQNVTI
jgi:tetratricopeptide (TPR) repeat protein